MEPISEDDEGVVRKFKVQPPSMEDITLALVQWYVETENVAQVPQLGHRISAGKQGGDHPRLNRNGADLWLPTPRSKLVGT